MNKIKLLAIMVSMIFVAQSVRANDDYLETGYKGMADIGYGISAGDADAAGRIGFTTTHGYQFNTYLFVGGGIGLNYYHEGSIINLPVFADVRATYPIGDTKFAPFVDVKIGYSAIDVSGYYFTPSVGARYALNENLGLSLGVGYEYQRCEEYNFGAVSIRFGIDF